MNATLVDDEEQEPDQETVKRRRRRADGKDGNEAALAQPDLKDDSGRHGLRWPRRPHHPDAPEVRRAGWIGLLLAGVCFILPAALIATALAWAYVRFGHLP